MLRGSSSAAFSAHSLPTPSSGGSRSGLTSATPGLTISTPEVFLREFGDSGIKFTLVTWAKAYDLTLEAQDDLIMRIYRRFSREGIVIPFPQMDVHLEQK